MSIILFLAALIAILALSFKVARAQDAAAAQALASIERDALAEAARIGVRVAQSYGIDQAGTKAQLEFRGAAAASRYLEQMEVEVTPAMLRDLLYAEYQTQAAAAIAMVELSEEQIDAGIQRVFFANQVKGYR